jgi:hypothetical protein
MMANSKVQRLQTRRLNDGEKGATVIVDYARNVGTMVQSWSWLQQWIDGGCDIAMMVL